MKNIIITICAAILLLSVAGCHPYNTWPDGLPELEHTYYVSNVKTGNGTEQDLQHEIAANGTARFMKRIHYNPAPPAGTPLFEWITSSENNVTCPIDIRFVSERVRSYDAISYIWVETRNGGLTAGRDYTVHAADGTPLPLSAQGTYSLTWPQAKKGQQSIKIKRLTSTVGELRVMYLDRSKFAGANPDRNSMEELTNIKTNDFTVRSFWHDYNYPVIIRFQ